MSILRKKAGQKVTALARIAKLLPFHKRRIILKSFIESQFSYCPIVWMQMNRKINRIHERALRLVYYDYTLSFKAKNHLSPSFMNEMFEQNKGPSTRMDTTFVRPKVLDT